MSDRRLVEPVAAGLNVHQLAGVAHGACVNAATYPTGVDNWSAGQSFRTPDYTITFIERMEKKNSWGSTLKTLVFKVDVHNLPSLYFGIDLEEDSYDDVTVNLNDVRLLTASTKTVTVFE